MQLCWVEAIQYVSSQPATRLFALKDLSVCRPGVMLWVYPHKIHIGVIIVACLYMKTAFMGNWFQRVAVESFALICHSTTFQHATIWFTVWKLKISLTDSEIAGIIYWEPTSSIHSLLKNNNWRIIINEAFNLSPPLLFLTPLNTWSKITLD